MHLPLLTFRASPISAWASLDRKSALTILIALNGVCVPALICSLCLPGHTCLVYCQRQVFTAVSTAACGTCRAAGCGLCAASSLARKLPPCELIPQHLSCGFLIGTIKEKCRRKKKEKKKKQPVSQAVITSARAFSFSLSILPYSGFEEPLCAAATSFDLSILCPRASPDNICFACTVLEKAAAPIPVQEQLCEHTGARHVCPVLLEQGTQHTEPAHTALQQQHVGSLPVPSCERLHFPPLKEYTALTVYGESFSQAKEQQKP